MLRYHYFGHGAFGRRLTSFRIRGPVIGENLAWGKGLYRRAGVIEEHVRDRDGAGAQEAHEAIRPACHASGRCAA